MGWSRSVCCHTAYASGAVQLRVFTAFRERVRPSALARADAIGVLAMDVIADTEVALLETQRGKSPMTKRSATSTATRRACRWKRRFGSNSNQSLPRGRSLLGI